MSRVFTSFRTERGNIRIWPVCKEYHPRPRGLYLIIYTLGVLWLLQKKECHAITGTAQTSNGNIPKYPWGKVGNRPQLSLLLRSPHVVALWLSLFGKKDYRSCRSRQSRLDQHVRKTRHRFLNMLRLLCLTLTLDFPFPFCLLLHFFSGFDNLGRRKGKRKNSRTRALARGEKETASGFPVVLNFGEKC